jgi:hypothetical protein
MTLQRFVFKTHKWLAAGVGLFTFTWFLSGIVMSLPGLQRPKAELGQASPPRAVATTRPDAQPFRQIAVSIPQAIAAAEAAAGRRLRIEHVGIKALPGRLVYAIEAEGPETFLIDTGSGARVVIDEAFAEEIAQRVIGHRAAWEPATLLREHTSEYKYGPLPVYRLAARDAQRSIEFVSVADGDTTGSTRWGRWRTAITQLHTFGFLLPRYSGAAASLGLVLFGAVGLSMTAFGLWILWLQFLAWLRARRREAA